MRVLACLIAALMGIQAVERLRLADGPHGCAGRLEVWHGGRWGTVCDDGWDLRDAAVACRELGCGGALAAPGGAFFGEGAGPVWLSELACRGSEGQLGLCPHRGWKAHICSHEEDAGVVCAGQRVANSRDGDDPPSILEGDPWPGLSGELSPGSEEPPGTHAPRPAGTPQNSSRKKGPRPPKQPKSTRAPQLTAGAPRHERLRLVSGPHGCSGRLEVWHGGRWGTVCDDGWDLRDAAVACRELGCGGALAAPGGARFGPGSGPVWMDDVGCGGGEQALRDCPRSPWGRSNCDHSEDAGLVCTGPAPRLRLADGPHGCAGRLEVWHGGRWGTVCDDAWDLRDASVACRELGCGGALAAPGGAFFGEGAGPILLDDLRCRGNETALRLCPARPWGQHDCHHREDAGAVCDGMPLGYVPPTAPAAADGNHSASRDVASGPPPPTASQASRTAGTSPPPASPTAPREPGPEAGSPQLRLVAGPSRCSGRLEVWHAGRWGTVCDDSWDLRDAAVVCRELGCGGARQPDPAAGRFGWGAGPIWLDDVGCLGTEASLSDCPAAPWGKHNCAHNEDVGVTCTETPGLDSISDPFSWSWIPGLGRDPDAWLPGELATKPSARLTPSVPEKTTTKAPGKMPKSTKKWVTKNAKRPTTQPPVMPTTKHSRVLGTQRPLELTSRTTTALTTEASHRPVSESTAKLTTGVPHGMTSHTTATRTPRAPRERTSKAVATSTTQGPREVTSEATATRIPLTPKESSAEIPAQGSPESPKDPAPSPTGSTTRGSGPFRVRLADGPNRCAGRLEVWHAGRWGTVCDDSWDLRDSTVACWELGCGRVRARVGKTHYGPGTGPIWLDDVGCKGIEASLSDCPAGAWGQHNCDHEEDVGLTCTGYADEDDYPPWTWDPTSGEDLAKGTTAAGVPGRMLSWGTTKSPGGPSSATRRLPHTGDKDGYESFRTWDTPSGGALPKGTPTTLTTGTTRDADHPSPAPRIRGDTGSERKLWPQRRLLRPTSSRTVPPAPSPDPSASSEPPGSPVTSVTSNPAPWFIPEAASTRKVTSDPPDTLPPSPDLASWTSSDLTLTTPGLTLSTPDATVIAASPSDLSPTPPPTLPKELTSDPSAPEVVTHLFSTSELTTESVTIPNLDTAPYPNSVPDHSRSPDPSTSPYPTTTPHSALTSHPSTSTTSQPTTTFPPTTTPHSTATPHSTTTPHPTTTPQPVTPPQPTTPSQPTTTPQPTTPLYLTTTPHPTTTLHPTTTPYPTTTPQSTTPPHSTTAQPTTTPHPITTSYPATTPDSTMTPHSTTSTHPTMTADPTSTPVVTVKSILTSLGTEFSPTPAPAVKPSLHPWLTSMGAAHLSQMSSLAPFPASESSHPRSSPGPSMDTLSTEDFQPPRSQSPKPTPPPTQTPHSASDPTGTSDLHLSSIVHPLDQPPPDHFTLRPTPGQDPGPVGPCVTPAPPVKVMACEPPALVELVAAVRDVSGQLQRLTQVLKQDQQQRQALELGLTQLVEATRGLGQLGEVVKRLAERAWPPSTPAPTTTTPEEEERPLRGDV